MLNNIYSINFPGNSGKRSVGGKNDKLILNDKKQRMGKEILNCTTETNINSKTKFTFNVFPKATYKNSIRY